MIGLRLEWERCPDGIEIVERLSAPGATIIESAADGKWLSAKTSRREPLIQQTNDMENPIVLRFINTRTENDLVEFHARFGMLERDSSSEYLENAIQTRENLHNWIKHLTNKDSLESKKGINDLLGSVSLKPKLEFTSGQKAAFSFLPNTLQQFMVIEVALAGVNENKLAECEYCGRKFLTGSLTGRRAHAKYCSDRCRVAAMRLRNKDLTGGFVAT